MLHFTQMMLSYWTGGTKTGTVRTRGKLERRHPYCERRIIIVFLRIQGLVWVQRKKMATITATSVSTKEALLLTCLHHYEALYPPIYTDTHIRFAFGIACRVLPQTLCNLYNLNTHCYLWNTVWFEITHTFRFGKKNKKKNMQPSGKH